LLYTVYNNRITARYSEIHGYENPLRKLFFFLEKAIVVEHKPV